MNQNLALIFLILCLGLPVSVRAENAEISYFDHFAHGIGGGELSLCTDGKDNDSDGKVDTKDVGCQGGSKRKSALECTSCHGMDGKKKIGHRECASCHNVTKILSINGGPGVPYCRSCHLNSEVFRHPPYKPSASMARFNTRSPEGGWSTFTSSSFNHEQHATWTTCVHCHQQLPDEQVLGERDKRRFLREVRKSKRVMRGEFFYNGFSPVSHEVCAACHDQKLQGQPRLSPQMNDCVACHEVNKPGQVPKIRPSQTTGYFTHNYHSEVLEAKLPCKTCHQSNGIDPKTMRVQLPLMPSCESCHNDDQAFGLSDCGKCHIDSIAK